MGLRISARTVWLSQIMETSTIRVYPEKNSWREISCCLNTLNCSCRCEFIRTQPIVRANEFAPPPTAFSRITYPLHQKIRRSQVDDIHARQDHERRLCTGVSGQVGRVIR